MLREIDIKEISCNPFSLIGEEWMLIATGEENKQNFMTASWGGLGVLWNKNVATIYVRNSRYTLELLKNKNNFSLNFFGNNKAPHKIGGSKSGRDIDKVKATGLTSVYSEDTVYYQEAELVFICKKLFHSQILPKDFVDQNINSFYSDKDYHNMFIGEIIKVLSK